MIAVDLATKMGIAFFVPADGRIFTAVLKGTPQEQLAYIKEFREKKVVFEQLNKFRNARTTRSLLTRLGYILYTLKYEGYTVSTFNTLYARKWIGSRNKLHSVEILSKLSDTKLTTDEADAIAILLACSQTKLEDAPRIVRGDDTLADHIRRPRKNRKNVNAASGKGKTPRKRTRRKRVQVGAK